MADAGSHTIKHLAADGTVTCWDRELSISVSNLNDQMLRCRSDEIILLNITVTHTDILTVTISASGLMAAYRGAHASLTSAARV